MFLTYAFVQGRLTREPIVQRTRVVRSVFRSSRGHPDLSVQVT